MDIQVWYPDVSEFGQFGNHKLPNQDGENYRDYNATFQTLFPLAEKQIQTELAYATVNSDWNERHMEVLKANGWAEAGRLLNWHQYHKGDNVIQLFIKKFPQNAKHVEPPENIAHWMSDGSTFKVAKKNVCFSFGCGGRFVDAYDLDALRRASYKPLTLLRLSKTQFLSKIHRQWLELAGYHEIASTCLATYYSNVQHHGSHDAEEERMFWKGWDAKRKLLGLRNRKAVEFEIDEL